MEPTPPGHTPGRDAAKEPPFAWPPRRASPVPLPRDADRGGGTTIDRPAHGPWWRDVESAWLDVTAAPLLQRFADAAFSPDEPWRYCPRCGESLGPHEHDATMGCGACRAARFPWSRFIRLGEYAPPLDRIIHEIKFTGWRRLGDDAGALLGRAIGDAIDGAVQDGGLADTVAAIRDWRPPRRRLLHGLTERRADSPVVIVPSPTSFLRRMQRGIDHPLVIARGISRVLGAPIVRALWRDHRPSQTSVPSSERAANVSKSIHLRRRVGKNPFILEGRLVIVVDDVVTTGATMRAACRQIRRGMGTPASGQIWIATVARTPDPERVRREVDQST